MAPSFSPIPALSCFDPVTFLGGCAGRAQLAYTDSQGFDVQLMLNLMEDRIADGPFVAQGDDRQAFRRERLVPEPSKRLGGLRRAVRIVGRRVREAADALRVVHAQPVQVFREGPRLGVELIQTRERRRRGMLARVRLLPLQYPIVWEFEQSNERRKRQALQHQSG